MNHHITTVSLCVVYNTIIGSLKDIFWYSFHWRKLNFVDFFENMYSEYIWIN